MHCFKDMLSKLGDYPQWHYHLQRLAHLGDFTFSREAQRILRPESGEKVLDMGCGLGGYSRLAEFYVGVDINERHLQFAKRHFATAKKRYFIVGDIRDIEFPPNFFDKSMCAGVMHHLDEHDCLILLKKLANFTSKKALMIVRLPPDVNSTFGEKFFYRLERGSYVRKLEDALKLIEQSLKVLNVEVIQNRTSTGRVALIPAVPK